MMYRLRIYTLFLLLLVITLFSCKDVNVVFYSFSPVPFAWEKNEAVVVALPDSMPSGEFFWDVEIRNTASYPYRDLWLEMEIQSEKAGRPSLYSRTLHVYLADSTGRWHDEGTHGTYFISTFPQDDCFVIADSTSHYQVRFRHIMEDKKLFGISDIGIKIKKKSP